jgi:hypothetical protein
MKMKSIVFSRRRILFTAVISGLFALWAGQDLAMAGLNLEVPIEMVDYGLESQAGSGTTNFKRSWVYLDPADYHNASYYFEIVAKNTNTSVAYDVYLRSTSTNTTYATITVPANTTNPTRFRTASSWTPPVGKQEFLVRVSETAAVSQVEVYSARIIVQQTNAEYTRIQIPLVHRHYNNVAAGPGFVDPTSATSYGQTNPNRYCLWEKDTGQYADLSGSSPWTLEAVLDHDSTSGTAYVALFNATTGLEVAGAEVSNDGDVITLVDRSFSDSATNFANEDRFELRIRSSTTAAQAELRRASLYVKLTNLSKAEVLYRVAGRQRSSTATDFVYQRARVDTSLFSNPTAYFQASGWCADNGERVFLRDHGTNDSGTGGASVTGSGINFNSSTKILVRTPAITITDGNRFYGRTENSTDNVELTSAFVVVSFHSQDPGIVNEGFEATGTYGYDETGWTEVFGSCTLDENAAIPGTPPVNLGIECLKATALDATNDDAYAYLTKTDQNISYVQGFLYLDEEGLADGQLLVTLGLFDSGQNRVAAIEIGQSGGQVLQRLSYWSNGQLRYTDLYPMDLDTWYEVEYKYDITNLAWEFRVNSITKASGSLVSPRTPRIMMVGVLNYLGTLGQSTVYTDLAVWHDRDWPAPNDCPVPGEPSGPTPGDGLTGVSIDADLDWADAIDAETYDVYFGTDSPPPLYAEGVTESSLALPTHQYCTRYYWGVVAKNSCGNFNEGVVWEFTTENGPPGTPADPSPLDGAIDVAANAILGWSDCTSTDTYDVFLDQNNPPTTKVASDITESSFDPDLQWDTHYYWKVVAKNNCGSSTAGAVWDFTTGPEPVAHHFVWDTSPSPGAPYDTWDTAAHNIGQALNAASWGETVMVRAGTAYTEHVYMKDGVDLVAEEGATPSITYSPGHFVAVVEITGPITCAIRGFDIHAYTNMGEGINLNGSSGQVNATIEDCVVHCHNLGVGIRTFGTVNTTIKDCVVYNCDVSMRCGIGTSGWGNSDRIASNSSITIKGTSVGGIGQGMVEAGIRLRGDTGASNIQVTLGGAGVSDGNTISHNGAAGVLLVDIDQISIENNDIFNNGDGGLVLIDSSTVSPHIKNNTIHHQVNAAGINIGGASNVTISDGNDIYANKAGIAFYVANNPNDFGQMDPVTKTVSSQPVTINGNNLYSNSLAGISIKDGITGAVTITQNNIYSNRAGIRMQRRCNLTISRNTIRDNTHGGIKTGSNVADGGGFVSGQIGQAVVTIEKNKIYSNGGGGYGGGVDIRHASGTIYNNLVYKNYKGGIRFGDYVTDIVNNTVVNNGNATGAGIVYDDLAGAVNDPPGGALNDSPNFPPYPVIRNNIIAYNETAGLRVGGNGFDCPENPGFDSPKVGDKYRDYNLLYSNNGTGEDDCWWDAGRPNKQCVNKNYGGCGLDGWSKVNPNDIIADPLFVDLASDDFTLQPGSPAENAGDDGNDMGAYGGIDPLDW